MEVEELNARLHPWAVKDEYIICAAIWYKDWSTAKKLPKNIDRGVVVAGMRHGDCIATFIILTEKRSVIPESGEYEQGFLTSKDRFLTRKEAGELANKIGQVTRQTDCLFSEDLY